MNSLRTVAVFVASPYRQGAEELFFFTPNVLHQQCPWLSEAPCITTWRYVAPMLEARAGHGVGYFGGKLFAAGGKDVRTVECFEWTMVRPLNKENTLFGLIPFNDGLLCVGKSSLTKSDVRLQ